MTSPIFEYDGELLLQLGHQHYLIKAKSLDGWYAVDLELGCTCRSYDCRQDCRHIRTVRQWESFQIRHSMSNSTISGGMT